jgi:hypothetical protein
MTITVTQANLIWWLLLAFIISYLKLAQILPLFLNSLFVILLLCIYFGFYIEWNSRQCAAVCRVSLSSIPRGHWQMSVSYMPQMQQRPSGITVTLQSIINCDIIVRTWASMRKARNESPRSPSVLEMIEYSQTTWDFRFSRRRVWRWLSSGLLRRDVWAIVLMMEAASTYETSVNLLHGATS